jgi:hypothetical protein
MPADTGDIRSDGADGTDLYDYWSGGAMSKPKVTDWIPGDQKPTIVGVYEREIQDCGFVTCSKWDGKKWHGTWISADAAAKETSVSDYQYSPWRGLASDPKGIK